MADGVGHDHGGHKLSTALVSKWPDAFDIENDIIKQGKADTFQRGLTSALRTRGLLDAILETDAGAH